MNTLQESLNWLSRRSLTQILLTGIFIGGGYVLWQRYQEQLYVYLPYLFLLLCPLMHVFLHKGHGGHGSHNEQDKKQEQAEDMRNHE